MTNNEAVLQLIRAGVLHHEETREEQAWGIATFYLVTPMTADVQNAMDAHRLEAERFATQALDELRGTNE